MLQTGLTVCIVAVLLALRTNGQQDNQDSSRQGKNLLNWIGFGTGPDTDPYLASANQACIGGDLAECFKSRALDTFDGFFDKPIFEISKNARIIRMPENHFRQVLMEGYEFSEQPRANEPEWDQLVKFVMRKVEKFLKSTAIEVNIDEEVTERGRYSPRFVDEIADEIDIIEDKQDSLFKRKQLKKLFIPLLLVLKLFKLKLLLFLPLILGLHSFKKFLGFLAIVIPGAIAYFKLCKPDFQSAFGGSHFNNFHAPQYSPAGIGYQPPYYKEQQGHQEYSQNDYGYNPHKGFAFRDNPNYSQNLAYSGYSQFRANDKEISAEGSSTKKSILPDS